MVTQPSHLSAHLCGRRSLRFTRVGHRDGLLGLPIVLPVVVLFALDGLLPHDDAKLGKLGLEGGDVEVGRKPRHQDAGRR